MHAGGQDRTIDSTVLTAFSVNALSRIQELSGLGLQESGFLLPRCRPHKPWPAALAFAPPGAFAAAPGLTPHGANLIIAADLPPFGARSDAKMERAGRMQFSAAEQKTFEAVSPAPLL